MYSAFSGTICIGGRLVNIQTTKTLQLQTNISSTSKRLSKVDTTRQPSRVCRLINVQNCNTRDIALLLY